MKDTLKKDMEEVDEALRDLFYIYQKSGKRRRVTLTARNIEECI